jgi:DNA-binding XRE family transcriptional regulator/Uma2 family endonuclease
MKNRLRALRSERNWSQANLAERLEVSRQTINALEAGKSDPSLPLAFKIAQLFHCPLEEIFFLEPKSMFARKFCADDSFEGFSQQAIEVMRLAQNESKRLRHNFVGTEQILLGLMAERMNFSAQLLQSMGVTLWKAQVEVQKIIGYGSTLFDRSRPLTPKAKRVVRLASEEASRFGEPEISTEHLMLGLIREQDGASATVLRNLGINLQDLEQQILEQLQPVSPEDEAPPTSRKIRSLSDSVRPGPELSASERASDLVTGELSVRLSAKLLSWVEPRQLGRVVVNTSFWLPNAEVSVPRLAFISRERLKQIPVTYPVLVPDLVVEIKSAFDPQGLVQEKIQLFINQGTSLGLLVEREEQTVACYRPGNEVIRLGNEDTLTATELLPGWELPVSELWPYALD